MTNHDSGRLSRSRPPLTRFAWLSIATALVTIGLKTTAYFLTGSVGLLSDALESTVNLVAAAGALVALIVAERPADEGHAYGHGKAEYLSSGFEGGLIVLAAASIGAFTAYPALHSSRAHSGCLARHSHFCSWIRTERHRRVAFDVGRQAISFYHARGGWASLADRCLDVRGGNHRRRGRRSDRMGASRPYDSPMLVAANIVWTGIRLMRLDPCYASLDTALPVDER